MQKKTWKTMKDPLGRLKWTNHRCHKKLKLKKTDIFDQEKIATEFNWFFANVGPILAKQVPESENTFESYLVNSSATTQHKSVSINELRDSFLLYANDLSNTSKILDPIMFADDTNLLFSNCDIPVLFVTVNSKLSKINQCLLAHNLSLRVTKTKYWFFHRTNKRTTYH